jgi:hypothetical protein
MPSLNDLTRQWRIVTDGQLCAVRRVALTADGHAVLLSDVAPPLEAARAADIQELLSALSEASRLPVLHRADLVTAEFFETARFVVQQRSTYSDYPSFVDVNADDGALMHFVSSDAAQAYIRAICDAKFARDARTCEKTKKHNDREKELREARRDLLEKHGLWSDGALNNSAIHATRHPERDDDHYRVVPIEESDWFYER